MNKITNIVCTNETRPLTIEEVIDALVVTGEKIIISNGIVTSQISWAPNNMIEIITVKKNMKIQNHIFMQFNGIETIKLLRMKTYKCCEFFYGYFED